MKLRPARSVRKVNSQAWSRYSRRKPRKSYVKALPHTSLLIFKMGVDKPSYDVRARLVSNYDIQLRSNALEAAREAANKYLEREIPNAYLFKVITYPHNVIREKKMATGAGADRISQGMTLAFGKPVSVAARVSKGQTVFEMKSSKDKVNVVKEAMRRASSKLSGTYKIVVEELQQAKSPA